MNKLIISNVTKTYSNGTHALKDISLEINQGMFGLLGPNGAGKSTLMRTISTLQEPDSGTIFFNDIDVIKQKEEIRKLLGYLPQDFGFYPKSTAYELLHHFGILKGIVNHKEREDAVKALLTFTNLYDVRNKRLGAFSGGMRQRFGIAVALLGNPKLIIVDEPTAGLDPAERNRFHSLLSELGENSIIILSTHIVDDVNKLCTDVAIIYKGDLLMKTTPQEALTKVDGKIYQKLIDKTEVDTFKKEYDVITTSAFSGKIQIHVHSETDLGPDFKPKLADLEDVYFSAIHQWTKNNKLI